MSNASMGFFRRKQTVTSDPRGADVLVPIVDHFDDLPPVHLDRARLDKAMAGERTMVPAGLSAEEVRQFMDHVAKDVK